MEDGRADELPDLSQGVRLESLAEDALLSGRVGKQKVLLCRDGRQVRAFGGECPHLGGPLDEGLIQDGVVRCPWHHACFDLRTGAAIASPAFDPLTSYSVHIVEGLVKVGERIRPAEAAPPARLGGGDQRPMVIVGGGAAGFAAAQRYGELVGPAKLRSFRSINIIPTTGRF
jgi:nitrite reductase/ring-hydroxylating ferredoxin subunit